jgi:hypothetical protein
LQRHKHCRFELADCKGVLLPLQSVGKAASFTAVL